MKNKILIVLTVAILLGAMLVGCAASDTNTEANNVVESNTEVSVDDFGVMEPENVETTQTDAVIETEKEEEVEAEVIEISQGTITGTETRYADGTSDYEIYYADSDINKTIHYRLTGLDSNVTLKDWSGYCKVGKMTKNENDLLVRSYSLYLTVIVDENYSYANCSDAFFQGGDLANYDISTFKRVQSDKDYRIYFAGPESDFGVANCKGYMLFVDDYATGRSFKIMLRGTNDFEYEELLNILNCIEIVEIID